MEAQGESLLRFLWQVSRNQEIPYDQREGATYVAVLFLAHRNTPRLMAQVSALLRGEQVIQTSFDAGTVAQNNAISQCTQLARRYGGQLYATIAQFNIIPSLGDFEGHPLKLANNLERGLEDGMNNMSKVKLHQALSGFQQGANRDLSNLVARYGYHYIFRLGLGQYYMT